METEDKTITIKLRYGVPESLKTLMDKKEWTFPPWIEKIEIQTRDGKVLHTFKDEEEEVPSGTTKEEDEYEEYKRAIELLRELDEKMRMKRQKN